MQSLFFRRCKNQSGQSTVEFALVFPLFLAVFIGVALFALLFYSYVTLQLAVRQGATYLIANPQASIYTIRSQVCNAGFSFAPANLSVKVEPPDLYTDAAAQCSNLNSNESAYQYWQPGVSVSVKGIYTVPLPTVSFPINGSNTVILGPIQLQASSVMTFD